MDNKCKTILVLSSIIIILVILLFSFVPRKEKITTVVKVEHHTDTVVVRKSDTLFKEHTYFLPGKVDTVFVFNEFDSLFLNGIALDTVFIDSLVFNLITRDTIIRDTFFIEKTITKETIKKQHLGFGVSVGIGGTYGVINKKFDVGPTVSMGLQYNF